MKLNRKQDLNVIYQVCAFLTDWKNKIAALAPDWLGYLWNRWTEVNETWQEARSQRPLPSLFFFGPIGKPRWRSRPLICREIFNFSETADQNSMKLDRKHALNVLWQACVFWTDRNTKVAAPASDWLSHFRLLFWISEQNSMKLGMKQDVNVLCQVCVFRVDWKTKMATPASDWLRHFRLLLWNR